MTLVLAVLAIAVVLALVAVLVHLRRSIRSLEAHVATLQQALVSPGVDRVGPDRAVSTADPERLPVPVITDLSDVRPSAAPITSGRIVSVTLAGPLIKIAALAAGLRRALDDEHRMRVSYAFRRELKRQRKVRRRAAAARARQSAGWAP